MAQLKGGEGCDGDCVDQECGINSRCDLRQGALCSPGVDCEGNYADIEHRDSCIGWPPASNPCNQGDYTDCGWIDECLCTKVGLIFMCLKGDGWYSEYYFPCEDR